MARILAANLLTRDPETGDPLVVLAGEPVPGWIPSSAVEHIVESPKEAPAKSTQTRTAGK